MSTLSRSRFPSSSQLLRRLIEDPRSAEIIRSLDPEPLARLIDRVGLEDAGEIVAFASTEQLLGVFDTDLWRREKGGKDDEFRNERFLLWLEILFEAGEKALVSRLSDLPEDLLISAFYSHILVLNLDDLAEQEQAWQNDDIDLADKALSDCITHELDEYCLVARKADGWDTILGAVLALYEHEPDLLHRILSRCCYASSEYIEDNGGLYDVLSAEEMLLGDAAADRDDRRAKLGYIAPSDATALFKLAVASDPDVLLHPSGPDPITQAYFRNFDKTAPGSGKKAKASAAGALGNLRATADPNGHKSNLPLLLKEAGIVSDSMDYPLLSSPGDTAKHSHRYKTIFIERQKSDPDGRERRVQELIYLANLIEARFGTSDAPIRPVEAADTVFDILDAGLAYWETTVASSASFDAAQSQDSKQCDIPPISLFLTGLRIVSKEGKIDSIASLRESARAAARSGR